MQYTRRYQEKQISFLFTSSIKEIVLDPVKWDSSLVRIVDDESITWWYVHQTSIWGVGHLIVCDQLTDIGVCWGGDLELRSCADH